MSTCLQAGNWTLTGDRRSMALAIGCLALLWCVRDFYVEDASENRDGNSDRKPLPQAFQKGVSGNPGGRPKMRLERLVWGMWHGGHELVGFWVRVWRGE